MCLGKTNRKRSWNTIRLRLTFWGAGVTTSICLLVCLIVYAGLSWSLHHEVDGILEGEIHELTARVFKEFGQDYEAAEQGIALELGNRIRGDVSYQLLDNEGKQLVSYDPEGQLPASASQTFNVDRTANSLVYKTITDTKPAYPVRVCTRVFAGPDGRNYVAQAGYMLDRVTKSLTVFRGVCALALVIAGAIAFVGGRIVAGRSLRPVQAIIDKSERITANALGERLPVNGTGDELDHLAETLNVMLDRIERHVTRLKQFTADASHELRSPITALRGNAEVALSSSRSNDEYKEVLQDSIDQYDRLARIAEDLLLLARADAGELSLQRATIQLDKTVSDVIDLYRPLAEEQGVEIVFTCADPITVSADDARLRQLFGNLLDNAIKYGGHGTRICITLRKDNGVVDITVADDGPGIPSEHLDRVFDRFYRVDESRSRKEAASAGLGLAICRTIAEAHGGSIAISSVVLKGTRVTTCIPQHLSSGLPADPVIRKD